LISSKGSAKDPVPDKYQYQNIKIPAWGAITKTNARSRKLAQACRTKADHVDKEATYVVSAITKFTSLPFLFLRTEYIREDV
jgi:ribonuclease D